VIEPEVWTPRFACPECGDPLEQLHADVRSCARCAAIYSHHAGCWRFLTAPRAARLEPFVRQYQTVRDRDGHRRLWPAEHYRILPSVDASHPLAAEWLVRRETFHHLLRFVLAAGSHPMQILDLGAGTGWLSHRLAALGQRVVAVDVLDDDIDGLGACRQSPVPFVAVQADFDALPFAPHQFDLVVFNGSLHYAPDAAATLTRARRMLTAEGVLVVMDSPMFHDDRDGDAMVGDVDRRFRADHDISDVVRPGVGYLTFARLGAIARSLDLRPRFVPTRGPLPWRMRRQVARLRLGRAPAAFGLWMAR
jgi:SAM-dependent methyltransferase